MTWMLKCGGHFRVFWQTYPDQLLPELQVPSSAQLFLGCTLDVATLSKASLKSSKSPFKVLQRPRQPLYNQCFLYYLWSLLLIMSSSIVFFLWGLWQYYSLEFLLWYVALICWTCEGGVSEDFSSCCFQRHGWLCAHFPPIKKTIHHNSPMIIFSL